MAADDSTSSSSADDDNSELPLKEIKSNTSHQELFDIKAILNKVNCPLSTKPEIPTKSSTEILSELFGAFNAEPPKIPDVVVKDSGVKPEKGNDVKKSKKSKKKHKHKDKKHKKSKHKKHSSNESNSQANSSSRKRKHKHSSELKKKKIKKSNKDACDVSVVESNRKGCDEEKQLTLVENVSVSNLAGDCVEVKPDLVYGPSLLKTVSSEDLDSGGKITDQVSEVKSVEGVKKKEIRPNCDTKLEGEVQESSSDPPSTKRGEIEVDPPLVKTENEEGDLVDCLSGEVTKESEVKGSTSSVGEPCKSLQTGKLPSERCKGSTGKITIKNLKFSSVYEETVRQVEEQARLKAEKYEEGEISDSSANPSPSDHSAVEDIDGNDIGVLKTQESLVPVIVPDVEVPDDPVVDEKPKNVLSPSLVAELPSKKCSKSSKSSRHNHSVRTSSESRSCSQDRSSKKRSSSKSKSKKKRSHSKEKEPSHRSKEGRHSRKKDDVRDSSRQRSRSKDSHISSKKSNKPQDSSQHRSESKNGHRSRKRDRSHENSRHRSRSRDSWKRDRSRDNSQHRRNLPNNSRKERSRGRTRSRSRHRSRSRSRSGNHIDKQKLLEIARKNAMALLKQGALPSSVASQEKVVAIKSGGKSVAELTDFCKQLSKKEAMGSVSSDSDGEDRHHSSDSENERPFHHPFQIKERPSSIVLNIRNSVQLPVKTLQEKTAEQSKQLRIQFPVSSGQQHRKSEKEWIPVSPKKEETLAVAKIPEPRVYPHPLPKGEVFPATTNTEGLDIGSIVSQRLTAMRKLQENPNDSQALTEMYQAQKDMQVWAESKQQPGQFTGTTGVRVLTAAELSSGFQAWAKKDQLKEATPVSGGMGMTLLQKMGWRPGEGLGKNKEGTLEPLQLEVKMDKKGLVSQEELGQRLVSPHSQQQILLQQQQQQLHHQQQQHQQQQQQQQLQQQQQQQQMMQQQIQAKAAGKHPVSLLVELCSKRKWGAPHFELLFECGPDHRKNFLFRVRVNGVEYKPSVASPNKKQAKAEAATVCLQALGVLPP